MKMMKKKILKDIDLKEKTKKKKRAMKEKEEDLTNFQRMTGPTMRTMFSPVEFSNNLKG